MNKQRADEFLKYLKDILIQNNDINLTEENVYSLLIRYGIAEEKQKDIGHFFRNWIDKYRNVNNINVFVSENWKYFCQFTNNDSEAKKSKNHLKLYIPLDAEHIDIGAQMIFDFLSKNNITHHSKIGKEIRFDNIVLRLVKEEELKKVLEFIKNNSYIQEGLIPANPFAFNKDGLAMACDGRLSFNMVTSTYISLYLKDKKFNKKLNEVNFDDYYNFVIEYYNKNFVNNFSKRIYGDFGKQFCYADDDKVKKDLKDITELIIKSNNNKFGYDDYIEHYNSTLDNKNYTNDEIENITIQIINVMSNRFGNYTLAKENIVEFFYTGRENYLTRDSGLRYMVVSSGFRDKLFEFLSKTDINISDYLDYIYKKHIQISDNKKEDKEDMSYEQKEELLYTAMLETRNKYNIGQVIEALIKLVFEGRWSYFTNDNNARANMIENLTVEDVKKIIKRSLGYQDEHKLNVSDIQYYCNTTLTYRKK